MAKIDGFPRYHYMSNQCEGYSPEDVQHEMDEAREESERQQALDVLMTGVTHCLDCTKQMLVADDQAGFQWTLCFRHREQLHSLASKYPGLF
jgi:hypothetical protein